MIQMKWQEVRYDLIKGPVQLRVSDAILFILKYCNGHVRILGYNYKKRLGGTANAMYNDISGKGRIL